MNKLDDHINSLRQLAANIARTEYFDELDELELKLQQEKLYLVVVGLFKRGKSSVINAILGKPLAPVAVTPVTAIITLFEYNNQNSYAAIRYKDGRIEERQIDEVGGYVNEDENPANEKQVQVVSIFDNAPILKLVSLVDTPGIGSSFEHNTATTLQFIPKIDAALFLLSADMPISSLDSDFLKELKKAVPKIVFVMNKKDLLNEKDYKKLLRHNSQIIATLMDLPVEQINFIAVSAREHEQGNKESGIEQLIGEIQSIATHEKTDLLQKAIIKRYRWLHQQLLMQMKLKSDSLLMPIHELKLKQDKLNTSILLMQDQQDEFESIIKSKISILQAQVDTIVRNESSLIKNEIFKTLDNQKNILSPDVLLTMQKTLDKLLIDRFGSIKEALELQTKEQFKSLLKQYSVRSQTFLNELASHLHSLLGISFDMIADRFDLDVYTSFYLTLDSGTGTVYHGNAVLHKLLPIASREKKLLRKLKEHYSNLIIRNNASIAYDLTYKIQESFRKFTYDLNNRLKELLISIREIIENTIEQKEKTESTIEQEVKNLNEKMMRMESIQMEETR